MKLLLILTIVFLSIANLSAQTPCDVLLANLPGKSVKNLAVGKNTQAVKNANTAMSLLQKSVTGFMGGQANLELFTSAWVDTRPYKYEGYTVTMYFRQPGCRDGKINVLDATGTWIYIGFNEIPFFRSNNILGLTNNCAEGFFCLPNGQQMFFSQYQLKGNFKGYPNLVPLHDAMAEAVFLSKSGHLPLRSVTQAEVLVEYKKWITKKKDVEIKRLEDHLANEPADIARATREESKKTLITAYNKVRGRVAELKNERAACIATVDSYLTKPIAKQPAVVEGIHWYCDPEKMFNPKSGHKPIMVFDDQYFDKTLPPASPQFIVVYWRKGDAKAVNRDGSFRFPLKREFIRKFEENFDFETLNKMLGQ